MTSAATTNPIAETIRDLAKRSALPLIRVTTDEPHAAMVGILGPITTYNGVTSATIEGTKVILNMKSTNHPAGRKLPSYTVSRQRTSDSFEAYIDSQNRRATATGISLFLVALAVYGLSFGYGWDVLPAAGSVGTAFMIALPMAASMACAYAIMMRNHRAGIERIEVGQKVVVLDNFRKTSKAPAAETAEAAPVAEVAKTPQAA